MDAERKREWELLGAELAEVSPEKYDEVLVGLRHVVEARRIIEAFDWEMLLLGEARTRHHA